MSGLYKHRTKQLSLWRELGEIRSRAEQQAEPERITAEGVITSDDGRGIYLTSVLMDGRLNH